MDKVLHGKVSSHSIPANSTFSKFVFRDNRKYLLIAALFGIMSVILLRILYPIPSFYSDSFTWVGAAQHNQPVSFRPIGYSKFIQFFKLFSFGDVALIGAQYLSNLLANLFLFFTSCYFFNFNKVYKNILFALLIFNPLYLFYSNYIYADAFFCSFTVVWFTLLIWIIFNPSPALIIGEVIVLAALFELRYNAIFFPFISTIALLFTRVSLRRKALYIALQFALVILLIIYTREVTKSYTGTRTFSAFSGWQLANDAMHVLKYDKIDTSTIADQQTRNILIYTAPFFDTASFIPSEASAWYMWHENSPLKKYLHQYAKKKAPYFKTWNALGPLYASFGRTIILKRPWSYIKHFAIPNSKAYFFPPLETYETYMEGNDTIAEVAKIYYHYKSNKTPPHHPFIYSLVFNPWKYLFALINSLFIVLASAYFITKKHLSRPALFNYSLLCFSVLLVFNFFFVVLLAPSVLRYHIFILTLSFPFILYFFQLNWNAKPYSRHSFNAKSSD